ncbi:putative type III effector protein XopR class [Xanthomonas bromi]|uniref:Putative type III effector protein XopR class n=1 Tax=Xanthomonas bromi TaxID=56449 RepID=A0A1C3NQ27_9XANT|nr:type III secretion system effector protein XopR [Xanthomonas bromi]PPV05566.1 hypothetical protein XbrCFBP1976_16200 [Xanthomonas bromi]SBV52444.1 putative type III effector protein XopR class [Xanthomonas bromi]
MRLSLFSSNYHRVAAEPPSPASTDKLADAPGACSQHPLAQAPKTDATAGASKSRQGMLSSARKSLATLRKQLPSMCLGSPTTKASQNPLPRTSAAPHSARRDPAPPLRVPPTRVDAQWQAAAPAPSDRVSQRRDPTQAPPPRQSAPTRATGRVPVRESSTGPARQRPAPSPVNVDRMRQPQPSSRQSRATPVAHSVSPQPAATAQHTPLPALRNLNKKLALLDKQKYEIDQRRFAEDRPPTAEEQQVLAERAELIARRNEVRDIQLSTMLEGLAPMETINAPRTTTSSIGGVQRDVVQGNRRALLAVQKQNLDMDLIAGHYARAQRRLQSLKDSGAPYKKTARLERMMQGYKNFLALQEIVKSTDDQLERMGGPRLMDSRPTTAEERRLAYEQELDDQRAADDYIR